MKPVLRLLLFGPRRVTSAAVEIVAPYSADSPWNTPIPASPTLHANSAAIVTKLTSWASGNPQAFQAGQHATAEDFTVPVYQAAVSDPLFTIVNSNSNARSYQISGTQIRIPNAAVPAGGTDEHLVVRTPDGEWDYEFLDVTSKPDGGGSLACTFAGRVRARGDGFDNANATAAKFATRAGRITTEEWIAGAAGQIEDFGHAISIMCKSTDGTNIWPASGNAAAADPTNAPPDGAWFQVTWTLGEIAALSIPNVAKVFLRTVLKYGMIVMDTTGNNGSWNVRSLGNDTADNALGLGTPLMDHAVAQGSAGGWDLSVGVWYFTGLAGLDWAGHLRVLDPTYMKAEYDARLAAKKLDPVATITAGWSNTGDTTHHACLLEATYAPFAADATKRIGRNTALAVANVRVETLTVPEGKTLSAIVAANWGNAAAAGAYTFNLYSGTTLLVSEQRTLLTTSYGWFFIAYSGSMTGVDLADIRLEFVRDNNTAQCNVYAAYAVAEYVDWDQ